MIDHKAEIEKAARAICKAQGYNPDALEPGDEPYQGREGMPSPCIDGYNRKDEPCHFFWRRFDLEATAAIDPLLDRLIEMEDALVALIAANIKRGPWDEPLGSSEQTPEMNMAVAAIGIDRS